MFVRFRHTIQDGSTMKLHIGCFNVLLEGWHNTDVTPHIFISRVPFAAALLHAVGTISDERYRQHREGIFRRVHFLDATKRFPFDDNSLDAVYSSQVLQNFSRPEAEYCLKETYRVLKPGGVCRIGVADLDRWIQAYDPHNPERLVTLLFQPETQGQKNILRWMYNEQSITMLFQTAGFRCITRCERHHGKCPDVGQIDYRADAMFIEGEK
jgi:SAM-dependent methyltransferase